MDKAFVKRASFGERFGALLLDLLIFLLIIPVAIAVSEALVHGSAPEGELGVLITWAVLLGLWSFYMVGMWAFAGATLGKKAVGIKIVGPDRKPPSLLRTLARYVMFWVSGFAFFIGFIWCC